MPRVDRGNPRASVEPVMNGVDKGPAHKQVVCSRPRARPTPWPWPLRWHMMYTRNSENMQVLELREESVGGTVRHHLPRGQDQAARRLLRRADAFRSLSRS